MVQKSEMTAEGPDWWSVMMNPMRRFGEQVADFFAPSSEAANTGDAYEISVELPGVSEDDIHLEVHDGRLTVTGEKKSSRKEEGKNYFFTERVYGRFHRAFRLPDDADVDHVSATHRDGVLSIAVPRTSPAKPAAKKIAVSKG